MQSKPSEIERRTLAALAAIKTAYDPQDEECSVTIFISHHLEELDESYWLKHLQADTPAAAQVLDLLVLQSHWGDDDEDGIDRFDFTLPGDVTDYVICVRFSGDGAIEDIDMES